MRFYIVCLLLIPSDRLRLFPTRNFRKPDQQNQLYRSEGHV